MVVAVVTSPVLAVKVPVGTKLNATWIGTAMAGEAPKAAPATPTSNAFRKLSNNLMTKLLKPSIGDRAPY
jgi:hypothetical protein